MRMKLSVMGVLISAILISCASIPPVGSSSKYGHVLVYTEVKDIDQGKTFVTYRMFYDEGKYILSNPRQAFTVTKNILPGQYTIEKMQNKYDSRRTASSSARIIPFTVKEQAITIFPMKMQIILNRDKGTIVSQAYSFKTMSDDDYKKCTDFLRGMESAQGYEIIK